MIFKGRKIFKPTSREKLKSESSTVTLIAVGDDLIHDTVFKSCRTADGYDFSPLYKNISKYAGIEDRKSVV